MGYEFKFPTGPQKRLGLFFKSDGERGTRVGDGASERNERGLRGDEAGGSGIYMCFLGGSSDSSCKNQLRPASHKGVVFIVPK